MSGKRDDASLAGCRPVVLGSEGRAGRAIAGVLAEVAPQTVASTRVEMDITDYFGLLWELERLEADIVINAAAWTDVDGCETDPDRAFAINTEGAMNVARAAVSCGARVIHLSTDYVFDGTKGDAYTEADTPSPVSVYARSKATAELAVLNEAGEALVVRTAWLFGGHGPNPDFVDKILAAARNTDHIPVVAGQRGSPTSVRDLAEGVFALLVAGATGVVHLTCSGDADRAEFAEAILDEAGLDRVKVIPMPVSTAHGGAERPTDSRLSIERFESLAGISPRPWREALCDVIRQRVLS